MPDLELEEIKTERQVPPVSRFYLAHSPLARIIEKVEVVKRCTSLQEHRTLYHTSIGFRFELLDLGNIEAPVTWTTPVITLLLHQRIVVPCINAILDL